MPNFDELVMSVIKANYPASVTLGGTEFWIDSEGPWKDVLSYDKPMVAWNMNAIKRDLTTKLHSIYSD